MEASPSPLSYPLRPIHQQILFTLPLKHLRNYNHFSPPPLPMCWPKPPSSRLRCRSGLLTDLPGFAMSPYSLLAVDTAARMVLLASQLRVKVKDSTMALHEHITYCSATHSLTRSTPLASWLFSNKPGVLRPWRSYTGCFLPSPSFPRNLYVSTVQCHLLTQSLPVLFEIAHQRPCSTIPRPFTLSHFPPQNIHQLRTHYIIYLF